MAKKRAFLKETGRACGFDHVEVRGERLEEFTRTGPKSSFDFATARAVGKLGRLVPLAAKCLKARGQIFLWLTHDQVSTLGDALSCFAWKEPLSIPLTRSGEIWHGTKQG